MPNEKGKKISLSDFKGKKVVLYFYPKDHTPGCTQEACGFRDRFEQLQSQNVVVLGVSKDSVKSHQSFIEKQALPFSLLSDETTETMQKYGAWGEKSMYGKKFMGIIRSTVLIDPQGKVYKTYPKVSVQGHVDQILEDLKTWKL